MINRRLAILPLLALAGTSLSGCVAVAIPALAGSAVVGTRVDGKGGKNDVRPAPEATPAAVAAAPAPKPPAAVQNPTVTVAAAPVAAAAPAPAPAAVTPPPAPGPSAVTVPATAPAIAAPVAAPAPQPAPQPAPVTLPAQRPAPPVALAAAAVPAPAPAPAPQAAAPVPYPDPANPIPGDQLGFARFVRYGQASANGAKSGADLLSAMLSDPVALDGQRRRCAVGEQPVALIDLDPKGGVFAPPANPAKQTGLALGLAILREAGVEIAWLSDLPVNQSGALRTALEQSGLDPRGQDIISLSRGGDDSKQKRRENLAGITCIVAIAGDERADFDERYRYLRSPEAGAGLEPLIGDGWFLIEPLLGTKGQ